MRLQILGAAIATSLALSATLTAAYNILPVSAGVLGLSLSYSFSIVSNLNGLVGSLTETEQEMVSVERVQEYVDLDGEYDCEPLKSAKPHDHARDGSITGAGEQYRMSNEIALQSNHRQHQYHPLAWNAEHDVKSPAVNNKTDTEIATLYGDIELSHVCMQYSPELPLALRGVSLCIPAGSKVAVVGRTGSGKSSLLRVLLRLNEYQGSIRIGGVDISTIPVHQLRRRLVVIPQDPVLLSASIRLNLDPTGFEYDDEQLLLALQASGFVWTLSPSHWKEIRLQQQLQKQQQQEQDQDLLYNQSSTLESCDETLATTEFKRKSFGDSDDIQWGHWLQRRHSGELGGAIVSDEELKLVLGWELSNAGEVFQYSQPI